MAEQATQDVSTQSFGAYVERRYQPLVRTAYLLVGDRGHAEDLAQSVLVQAMRHWDRIEAPDAYTRTALIRLAGRWRARRWHGELPSAIVPDRGGPHTDTRADIDTAVVVRAALARLPWPQRAVLVLRYFDDLTEAQTATALGCSIGTVKSRASRALAALRADGLLRSEETHDGRP